MERDTKTKTITVTVEVRDEWEFPKFERDHCMFGECVSCVRPARLRKHSFIEHVFDGAWHSGDAWYNSDPPPEPVRIAAEELYWRNKTLAENEFRDSRGDLWQFKDPSFDSLSYRVFEEDCSGSRFHWTDWTKEELEEDGEVNKAALAWHRRAYALAPDEARDERGVPVKMKDDEVRDGQGRVEKMVYMPTFDDVSFGHYCRLKGETTAKLSEYHPCCDPSQLARVVAFWERSKADKAPKERVVFEGKIAELWCGESRMFVEVSDENLAQLNCRHVRITVLGEEEE